MAGGDAHYIKPAGKTYTPPVVIFLDSESRQHDIDTFEVHTLRLFEAQVIWRRDRRKAGQAETVTGTTPGQLAAAVDRWAGYAESSWLYAHNVTFDLTVTKLATELGQLGWVLSSRFATGGDSMWAVFHKGERHATVTEIRGGRQVTRDRVKWSHTLTIADSASLFPGQLAQLGGHVGIIKPPLPDDDDSDAAWAARCHADVEIMKRAVLQLMEWWEQQDLGHWTVTGAGQAWQSYKRTLNPRQLVIDHDPGIIEIERAAVYGGRRDAFRVGPLPAGRYAEIDYTGAYPTIAASYPMPAKVACDITDAHRALAMRGRVPGGMLAEVTIDTDRPRWPVRLNGRVFYPVGRFRTTLAAPDIQAAADAGCLAAVHNGVLFTMTNHLRPWARQVLAWVRNDAGTVPGVVRLWAKLASRAVIGKFAQRGWSTMPWVGPPCDGWSVEQTSDFHTGMRGVVTGVNGDYYLSWADQRGEHERPAVLAFVEAHVRRRLGAVIDGPYGSGILQCDTDGVMVSHTVLGQLAAALGPRWVNGRQVAAGTAEVIEVWNAVSWPLIMREKTQFTRGVVYGPQQVMLDGRLRAAGVPKSAWHDQGQRWLARLWPGIVWQSQHAHLDGYARPVQPYRIAGPYVAAWVLDDGSVRAAEAAVSDDGQSALLHWKLTRWAAEGLSLGPRQAAWADGLWEAGSDVRDAGHDPAAGAAAGSRDHHVGGMRDSGPGSAERADRHRGGGDRVATS